jgi:hypothetical protein
LVAAPLLAEQALEEIRGADRTAMRERELQVRDACVEVVVQARHGRGQVAAIGRRDVVAQQPRQRRRRRPVVYTENYARE